MQTSIFSQRTALRRHAAYADSAEAPVRLIRGVDAILREQPRLADLARQTGQTGEVDSLGYFLSTPDAVKKTPWLLLFEGRRRADHQPGTATSDTLHGAVLLFEYKTALGGTGVFSTADGSGRRDVLAASGMRARTAAFAARTLLARGAHVVHLAFCEGHLDHEGDGRSPEGYPLGFDAPLAGAAEAAIESDLRNSEWRRPGAQWTLAEREIPAYLPLFPTFEQTLARIGRKTRANLRYYRRRAEADLGATFVPMARPTLQQFLQFNRECMFSVPEPLAAFRHRAAETQPRFCIRGVCDRDGRWLSLVGLRRQNNFVELDWQMNRSEHSSSSLGIVMRSYLIEHEIALGSTRLYIEGGTPHPIGRSFLNLQVGELTVKRNSTYVRVLRRVAPLVVPEKNYISQILARNDLSWRPV